MDDPDAPTRPLAKLTRPLPRAQEPAPAEDLFDPARGLVCARCGQPTGNFTQGHYWRWCRTAGRFREEFHFCCPGDCETAGAGQGTRR